ncbi:MAG: hypothetical protein OEL84_06320 [Nitrosopumilus sp.]|nr:hypothetical protein [Nitrosopumilus sp.]
MTMLRGVKIVGLQVYAGPIKNNFLGRLVYFEYILDFFKKRIRQFQEKKLGEILSKIQFHQYMKKQAEQKLGELEYNESNKIKEEISFNEKMIEIWQRNEEKLRKQMRDLEEQN